MTIVLPRLVARCRIFYTTGSKGRVQHSETIYEVILDDEPKPEPEPKESTR